MAFKSDQLPVVSIIIPLDDHAKVLGPSIESCLAQAYPNVEILLIDNWSSDSSIEIARSYEPRVRIINLPQPVSVCTARNVGLSHAVGDFVLFHESDDLLFPDRLWHDLEVVNQESRVDVVVSVNRWFKEGEPLLYSPLPMCRRERRLLRHLTSISSTTEWALISMLQYDGPQHSCALYRTSVVRAMGGYNDEPGAYADRDLLFRALCRGARVAVNPRITSAWRLHNCEKRMAPALRKDDHLHRLALAKHYLAALEQSGLLYQELVRNALVSHVMTRIYDYAKKRHGLETAGAALDLVASLRKGKEGVCNTSNEGELNASSSISRLPQNSSIPL